LAGYTQIGFWCNVAPMPVALVEWVKVIRKAGMGVILVFRDITERERAQNALEEQRELLRVTLASIGDAVITTDTAGRITFLNPAAIL